MMLCRMVLLAAATLVLGCGTLSKPLASFTPGLTPLPEAELRSVAAAIERSVRLGDPGAAVREAPGVSVKSPLLLQALRTRTLRHPRVTELLRQGHVYELRNGLIKIKTSRAYSKATTRQGRDQNAVLVQRENEDRWSIYEALIEENTWPGRSMDAVRAIFFEVRVDAMVPGEYYESGDGGMEPKGR